MIASPPPPPPHLSPSSAAWWTSTVEAYVLQPHHLRLLQLACESWDRCQAAREQLDRDGLTIASEKGGIRPHPCIAVERDNKIAFARLLRELDLDTEPPVPERIAPPPLCSNNRANRARKAQDA
jgi:P27 family predicted phage terminase small subunit